MFLFFFITELEENLLLAWQNELSPHESFGQLLGRTIHKLDELRKKVDHLEKENEEQKKKNEEL